jgi:4-aminobutyrate aminotransferase/(S)-3-amino-2-methylpropionate transaminase
MSPSHPKNQRVELVSTIPGPKSLTLRAREDEHIAPGLQGYAVSAGIAIESAIGSAVTDVDGNTFLDIIGGIGVNALGHSHPRMIRAMGDQLARASVGSFTTGARVELVERLSSHAPAPGVHRTQLYSSGAEAVESALRLAKSFTGKNELVSFWGAFHGKTMGALSLMGSSFKNGLGPMVPGSHIVPYADCYRCPVGLAYPSCGIACAELAKKQIKMQSSGSVAAIVVEPIQGTAGNIVPPNEFLPIVREMARELGALFIADEMITGFGRTGKYWGTDHSGARPDIVTIGKAFGGGFPLSGVVTTDEIARSKPWSNPSGSSSSYGGNPLASAAGAAALRIIDEEMLVENSRVVGGALLEKLLPFVDDYPFVGTVRGRGLLIGMELVSDKTSKEPLARAVTGRLFDECVKRGLLSMVYAPSFRIQPPLTIDLETAENAVAILREVFDLFKEKRLWEAR